MDTAAEQSAKRFGQNLRRARKKAHLTQEALAEACGVHSTEIGRLERGVRDPRLSTVAKVARGLKVKPAKLFEGIE